MIFWLRASEALNSRTCRQSAPDGMLTFQGKPSHHELNMNVRHTNDYASAGAHTDQHQQQMLPASCTTTAAATTASVTLTSNHNMDDPD